MKIMNLWPRRYGRHFLTAIVTECSSRTYVEARSNFGVNCLLKKAISRLCCINIAPMVVPDALVSISKGYEKSGGISTGACVMADFNASKASWDSGDHLNWSRHMRAVREAVKEA